MKSRRRAALSQSIFPLDLEKAGDKDFAAIAQAIKLQLGRLDGILHNAALAIQPDSA